MKNWRGEPTLQFIPPCLSPSNYETWSLPPSWSWSWSWLLYLSEFESLSDVATRSLSSILRDKNLGTFHVPGDVGWWGRARQGTSCLSGGNYYDQDGNVGDEEGEYDRYFNRLKLMSAFIYYIKFIPSWNQTYVSVTTGPTMPAMLKVCEILTADLIANTYLFLFWFSVILFGHD